MCKVTKAEQQSLIQFLLHWITIEDVVLHLVISLNNFRVSYANTQIRMWDTLRSIFRSYVKCHKGEKWGGEVHVSGGVCILSVLLGDKSRFMENYQAVWDKYSDDCRRRNKSDHRILLTRAALIGPCIRAYKDDEFAKMKQSIRLSIIQLCNLTSHFFDFMQKIQ